MRDIEVQLLGNFQLTCHGKATRVQNLKAQALIAYLALQPGESQSRTELASLLWGNQPDGQARANLRQCLFVLRDSVGTDTFAKLLRTSRDSVGLDHSKVAVDVLRLRDMVARANPSLSPDVVDLCSEELLRNFSLREDGFEDWLQRERQAMARLAREVLERYGSERVAKGDLSAAIKALTSMIDRDPFDEDAHRRLILLYATTDRRSHAVQHYNKLVECLRQELDVEPDPETQSLYKRIRGNEELMQDLSIAWPEFRMAAHAERDGNRVRDIEADTAQEERTVTRHVPPRSSMRSKAQHPGRGARGRSGLWPWDLEKIGRAIQSIPRGMFARAGGTEGDAERTAPNPEFASWPRLLIAGAAILVTAIGAYSLRNDSLDAIDGKNQFDGDWQARVSSLSGCINNHDRAYYLNVSNGEIDKKFGKWPKKGKINRDGNFIIRTIDGAGRVLNTQTGLIIGETGEGRFVGIKPGCSGIVTLKRFKSRFSE